MMEDSQSGRGLILVDGGCALCNGFARFVARRDRQRRFELRPGDDPATVVLLEDDKRYVRSTAVLRILLRLGFPWSWLGRAGFLAPLRWRDAIYDLVAANRRKFACRVR